MPLRIVFMGTPEFSVATLRALAQAGHEIVAVYSQPPRPAGRRGLELTPSPVQREAERLGIPVLSPVSLKGEAEQSAFRALRADVAVVVAYGLLLPAAILEGTRLGCYNGHASLLPRWRGAAPIQRAIMAGDAETGMMIMKMDEGLDTGAVALTERVAIAPDMTGGELHDRLSEAGAALMVEAMAKLERGELGLTPQPADGVTYAKKIDKALFPGVQGGPLMHIIASKAVAFGEALQPSFKTYCTQVVKNAKALAAALAERRYRLCSGGTDTHLMLVDLRQRDANLTGADAEKWLESAGIITNKNGIPNDPRPPRITSGLRLGSPALTTRGFKEAEMSQVAEWIDRVLGSAGDAATCEKVRGEIVEFCKKFPLDREH